MTTYSDKAYNFIDGDIVRLKSSKQIMTVPKSDGTSLVFCNYEDENGKYEGMSSDNYLSLLTTTPNSRLK